MPSLRILMISALEVWALSGQGGAPSLFKTLEGYSRRGHSIDFISSRIGANHHHGAPPQEPPDIANVRFHLFDLPSVARLKIPVPGIALKADQKMRFAALFPYVAARRAEALLHDERYDVLYGYEVHGVLAQRRVRRKHNLPLVARFQGTVMHPYLRRPHSLLRKYEEVLALKTPAELYIMTDDGTQGDEVLERLNPNSAGKVCFWRNGLDLGAVRAPSPDETAEARRALGLAPHDFVLATATRLARWKRVDRGVDAVALLRKRGVPARLLIVGDGEERTNLQEQVRNMGLDDAVTFVGAVPQPEVQRYLWAADVFLSVNELSNVGNPLLEAMLASRCVLTLDEGDTRDLIHDGETGILLQSGEPEDIAAALASLAEDPGKRRRMGLSAHRLAERSFWSWDQRLDAETEAVEALVADTVAREGPLPAHG
ncbi:MAG TPA: glycosyltransferase family 4 protein [Dehalococcoidia bacterium]|jgi:glycosyltransferase involved in cell wall biosynthesis|nr:glycosyltransferase family 4 protein [Dehalococcoidia bacterium]